MKREAMNIGLIDVDGHNFPNLALMKISAWHKSRGDHVEWCVPIQRYDRVYQSRVFDDTYSADIDWIPQADEIIKGGTGYGLDNKLPDEIEHIYPDYSLYPYIMIYDKPNAPREIRWLQRWVNNKAIFRSCPNFEDYKP